MNTDRFQALSGAPGPFVSLYIEGTVDSQHAAARWGAIRRHLEDSGVAERTTEAVERAVLSHRSEPYRRGHAVIAGGEGVLLTEPLTSPPPVTVLRVSDYPYLLPLLGSGRRGRPMSSPRSITSAPT